MKPSKKIFLLTGLVSAIVIFWLLPGINAAKHVRYTRRYEDTYRKPEVARSRDTTRSKAVALQKETKSEIPYKTETIEEDMGLSDIDAKMYSRAIHYEEELLLEVPLALDTVIEINLEVEDSVLYAAADTVVAEQ